jgi:hypothetical protein
MMMADLVETVAVVVVVRVDVEEARLDTSSKGIVSAIPRRPFEEIISLAKGM